MCVGTEPSASGMCPPQYCLSELASFDNHRHSTDVKNFFLPLGVRLIWSLLYHASRTIPCMFHLCGRKTETAKVCSTPCGAFLFRHETGLFVVYGTSTALSVHVLSDTASILSVCTVVHDNKFLSSFVMKAKRSMRTKYIRRRCSFCIA